eukprot:3147801-Rhodomonas_salina.1
MVSGSGSGSKAGTVSESVASAGFNIPTSAHLTYNNTRPDVLPMPHLVFSWAERGDMPAEMRRLRTFARRCARCWPDTATWERTGTRQPTALRMAAGKAAALASSSSTPERWSRKFKAFLGELQRGQAASFDRSHV